MNAIKPIEDMPAHYQGEAVRRLFEAEKPFIALAPFAALAIVWGLWAYVDHTVLLGLMSVWCLVPLSFLILSRSYHTRNVAPENAYKWGNGVAAITACDGVLCGLGAILFQNPNTVAPLLVMVGLNVGRVS